MLKNSLYSSRSSGHHKRRPSLKNSFNIVQAEQLLQVYYQMYAVQPEQTPPSQANEFSSTYKNEPREEKELQEEEELDKMEQLPVERQLTDRDLTIRRLRQNNRMITQEVQNIWQKMKQYPEPSRKRKLVDVEDSYQKLSKDLKNAYNWIKIVEKELQMHRKRQKQSASVIENMRRCRKDLFQRQAMIARLKVQLHEKNRQMKSRDKTIYLKVHPTNDSINELKILTDEVNHLYEMVQQAQRTEQKRVNTLKKQYSLVKKMERDLVEKGMSQIELDELKKRCIRQIPNRSDLTSKRRSFIQQTQWQTQKSKPKEITQRRTRKKLRQMQLEILMLQKKHTQFQIEYSNHEMTKSSYSEKNRDLRRKLDDSEIEIEKLQLLSQKLRGKHLNQHRRKARLKSLEIEKVQKQKEQLKRHQRQLLVEQHRGRKRKIKSMPHHEVLFAEKQKQEKKSTVDTSRMPDRIRCEQFGLSSSASNKFNDKYVLERQNQGKRITGINIYFSPDREYISGINVTYESEIKGGDYVLLNSANTEKYKIESYECSDLFIKDLFPVFTKHNAKSKLIGLTLELSDGIHKEFGQVVPFRSALSDREYVSNICGAMGIVEVEGYNISVIEELGMQIYE